MPLRVFISYSRQDMELVKPVVGLLRATRDMVFHDVDSIRPGGKWHPQLLEALKEANLLVVFWCGHSAASPHVREEYETAMREGKDVLPLLIDETPLPDTLAEYQWIDFRGVAGPTHGMLPPPKLPSPSQYYTPDPDFEPERAPAPAKRAGGAKWTLAAAALVLLALLAWALWSVVAGPSPGGGRILPAAVAAALLGALLLLARRLLLPHRGPTSTPVVRAMHRAMAEQLGQALEVKQQAMG